MTDARYEAMREGIAVCGTVRGYLAHQYRQNQPCDACRDAWQTWRPASNYPPAKKASR